MNILYLAFGTNQSIYYQTQFSIQTMCVYHPNVKIHIVTDHPEFFNYLSAHLSISTIMFDKKMFDEWTLAGEIKYMYRIKLKIIEQFISQNPNTSFIFMDSDTFTYRTLNNLFESLHTNKALMHEPERPFSEPNTKTARNVWNSIKGRQIGGINITADMMGWNSGVIGIPSQGNKVVIKQAIEVCDELCALVKRRNFVEQIAFSMTLSAHYELIKANDCIGHYWGNKDDWNLAIMQLYMDSKMQGLSFGQEQELIQKFNFKSVAYRKHENNTQQRLCKLVKKHFPNRDYRFME